MCNKSKQIRDIIRVATAAAAFITFQEALLYIEHFGEFSNYTLTGVPGRQACPHFRNVKTSEGSVPAQGHTSRAVNVTSAGVQLPHSAFEDRAQISPAP